MRTLLAICFCLTYIVGYGQNELVGDNNQGSVISNSQSNFSNHNNTIDPIEINSINSLSIGNDDETQETLDGATCTTLIYYENDGVMPIEKDLSLSDVSGSQMASATVHIYYNFKPGEDSLVFEDQNGITGSYNPVEGKMKLSGTASKSIYQEALRSVGYINISEDPDINRREVNFYINNGSLNDNFERTYIEVESVNDPPVISGSNTILEYQVGSGPVVVDNKITISDVDDTLLVAGRIWIRSNYKITEDLITAAEQFGISVTYDESTSHLYFKGIATIEEYEIILSSGTYENSNPDPELSYRRVSFKVFDEDARSNFHTRRIEIIDRNLTPVIVLNNMPIDTLFYETEEDVPLDFCLDINNEDNLDLVFSLISPAREDLAHGSLIESNDGEFCLLYTPEKDFYGRSIWDLEVCSDSLPDLCDGVVVVVDVISVNDGPIAVNDTVTTTKNYTLEGIVTDNDYDTDGNNLILDKSPVTNPMHGTVILYDDGSFEYTPDQGYYGEDRFTYNACDDGEPSLCASAEVIITVEDVPLKVYNAVSPNGDDLNDYLYIEGIEYYPGNLLSIYDRYNNLVYETLDYNNDNINWQGQANKGISTRDLPGDTYFYILNPGDGTPLLKGFIMLKKE
jgi:gliding motility-associated-like protein